MTPNMGRATLAAAVAIAALATTSLVTIPMARAQAPAGTPQKLSGVIAAVEPGAMSVTPDGGGGPVIIRLPSGTRYGTQVERSLADIKPGEFVGAAAMRGRDGRLHAQEVHIFPDSMRGTGEGHRPMDQPEQSMTNATVDGVAQASSGRVLRMRYAGGEQAIEVGPDVRVVGLVPGDSSLLVPGAAVTVRAMLGPDGVLTAVAVQAEKDGVKPLP